MDTIGTESDGNVKKLGTLIEALTHSGSNTLDEDLLKQVKKICKTSQIYISRAYDFILTQLKKKNSQIRYLAFQICNELFNRSSQFRDHVVKDLQLIFKLTAEINSKSQLPPPKPSAQNLKAMAIRTLQIWVNEFGETYKELKIAYNYFKGCKKINFDALDVRIDADRIRQNETEQRQRLINEEKMKKVKNEVNGYKSEIEETLTSLSNCLKLLLPTPGEFFVHENNLSSNHEPAAYVDISQDDNEEISEQDLRHFGITSDYNLLLNINPNEKIKINKTEENSSIIDNAKDCVQLISCRFLPLIKKWSHDLCKYSNLNSDELKEILEIQKKVHQVLDKYKALDIDVSNFKVNDTNDSSEDDFEEVIKEGYEDSVEFSEEDLPVVASLEKNEHRKSLSSCQNIDKKKDDVLPSSSSSEPEPEPTNRKNKLLKIAPKLPFDIDLYHWEDDALTVPTLISTKIDVDKFWGCAGSDDIHEIPNPEGVAALRTRVIEFTGKFEPVKWTCRAPLPSGQLCPRKDRYKCPFHGKIVPRDEKGKCQNIKDERNTKGSRSEVPDWQDPQLLADLKASTGIDLKMPERRGTKRKSENANLTQKKMKTSVAALKIAKTKNFPGLVDVIRKQNTSYTRLSKKIFNRSTVKRVCAALNKIDKNKYNDKFGDCFNYS